MSLQTQGTQLYFINPLTNDLVEVGCPTSISGLDSTLDQIDITCLKDKNRQYKAGLGNPSAFTFGINFDPADASHLILHSLSNSRKTTEWVIALSDGAENVVPTVDTAGNLTPPTTRSFWIFEGYVASLPFSANINEVYTSEVSVQVSGDVALFVKTT